MTELVNNTVEKKKPSGEGYRLILDELKKNPNISFLDIRAKATKKGLIIHPVSFGRAQRQLGIVGAKAKDGPKGKTPVAFTPEPENSGSDLIGAQNLIVKHQKLLSCLARIREQIDEVLRS